MGVVLHQAEELSLFKKKKSKQTQKFGCLRNVREATCETVWTDLFKIVTWNIFLKFIYKEPYSRWVKTKYYSQFFMTIQI